MIASYFEWLQNKRSEFWDLADVDTKLDNLMISSDKRGKAAAGSFNTDWRTAAYIVALKWLEMVYKERSVFP